MRPLLSEDWFDFLAKQISEQIVFCLLMTLVAAQTNRNAQSLKQSLPMQQGKLKLASRRLQRMKEDRERNPF